MTTAGRRHAIAAAAVILILLWLACTDGTNRNGVAPPAMGDEAGGSSTRLEPTRGSGTPSSELEVTVGPARQECYGPFRRMCLIVDGGFFYNVDRRVRPRDRIRISPAH